MTVEASGGGNFVEVIYDDFESGWGNWNDGGTDAKRPNKPQWAPQGNRAVNLQDNTNSSVTTTDNLSFSGNSEIKVEFDYRGRGMENNEDFWLQISTDGGASFQTVQSWVKGIDFSNNVTISEAVTISGYALNNQTQLRFRCDATANNDNVHLDVIRVSAK